MDWRIKHGEVIREFLYYLNNMTNAYVLKGGTALTLCYHLDRFSEDIDLDSTNRVQIQKVVESFCEKNHYTYRVGKDTNTVKRYFIHYQENAKPLKIEVSYRERLIRQDDVCHINGITVYSINKIAHMKSHAYDSRDRIRDLYDIVFICKNYFSDLTNTVQDSFRENLKYKGIEQFDYLIYTQKDDLIDADKLAGDFLDVFDMLGIIEEKNDAYSEEYLEEEVPAERAPRR